MEGFFIFLIIFTLITLLIVLLVIWIKMIKKHLNKKKQIVIKKEKSNCIEQLDNVKYIEHRKKPMDAQGKMFQLLESLHLIITTKNRDILTARYSLAKELLFRLRIFKNTSWYNQCISDTMEEYKQMYYDKSIRQEQVYFLKYPDDLNMLEDLYIKQLTRCFSEYAQMHEDAIINMVQKNAKVKRYKKIITSIQETIEDLELLENSTTQTEAINQLQDFIPKVESKIKNIK